MLIQNEELLKRGKHLLRSDKDFFDRCADIASKEFERNGQSYYYGVKPYVVISKNNAYMKLLFLNDASIGALSESEDHCDFFKLLKQLAH